MHVTESSMDDSAFDSLSHNSVTCKLFSNRYRGFILVWFVFRPTGKQGGAYENMMSMSNI